MHACLVKANFGTSLSPLLTRAHMLSVNSFASLSAVLSVSFSSQCSPLGVNKRQAEHGNNAIINPLTRFRFVFGTLEPHMQVSLMAASLHLLPLSPSLTRAVH